MRSLNVSMRNVMIVVGGNILWLVLTVSVIVILGLLGVTPIGEFAKYTLRALQHSNSETIIEDPKWGQLLEGWQFFVGIIITPLVSVMVAFFCTITQGDAKLPVTYVGSLGFPIFYVTSYYLTNAKIYLVMGVDLNTLVPIISFFLCGIGIYLGYLTAVKIKKRRRAEWGLAS